MNIHQAINRIAFRFKGIKPNQLDQEALDVLVDYVNGQSQEAYMNNLLFAKLFVEKFMSLAQTGEKDAQGCLDVIEKILSIPLMNIIQQFKDEVPLFKFQRTVAKYKRPTDPFDLDAIRKEHHRISRERTKELLECFKNKWTTEQAIDFLTNEVNRMDKLYNKKELA